MKILITGVGGFIGSHLAEELSKKHNIIGTYNTKIISGFKRKYTLLKVDLTKQISLKKLAKIDKIDLIIHLAAITNPTICKTNPSLVKKVNYEATKKLIDFAKKQKNTKFILFSSGSVFSTPNKINKKSIQNSKDVYSVSKILCHKYIEKSTLNHAIIFPNFPYGPHQNNQRLIPKLISKIKQNKTITLNKFGTPQIQPIYINDLVIGIKKLIETNFKNGYYFFSGPQTASIEEIVQIISKILKTPVKLKYSDKKSNNYIFEKTTTKKLDFKSKITIRQGIKIILGSKK